MTEHKDHKSRKIKPLFVGLAVCLVIVLGAVYVINGPERNGQDKNTAAAVSTKTSAKALNRGHMITFVIKKTPQKLPELKFTDGNGAARSLADWRGKVVLINLWATWCAPCRKEMPSLLRLDQAFKGKPFDVVAVSIDRKGLKASKKFLDKINASALGLYADPSGKIREDLRVRGLPGSVLVDRQGREIGRLTGPAEWDSDDAKRLIQAAIDGKLKWTKHR